MMIQIKLLGLHCPACKKLTEKRIGSIFGVSMVETDLNFNIANVEVNRSLTVSEINQVLLNTPYSAYE